MPPAWRLQAACLDADLNVFFPSHGEHADAAKAICARCPVRAECLAYALELGAVDGIWAGLNRTERRQLEPPGRRPRRPSYGPLPSRRTAAATG